MSKVTVRIPTPLRSFVGGAEELAVEAETVSGLLVVLAERHRGLTDRVCDAQGKVRPFVNLYIGSKNIKSLSGLETALSDGDVLSIVPAVAGG